MPDAQRPSRGALVFAWTGAAAFVASLLYFLYSYLVRFGRSPAAGSDSVGLAVAADVGLFSVFALHHSVAARAGIKDRLQRLLPFWAERSLYTWTSSLLFIVVCASWRFVPGELYGLTGLAALPGYAVQVTGIVLTIRNSARLDVLELAGVRPALEAMGAAPPGRVALETRGMYKLVRHPLYLAWILLVFGAPHMTMTRLVFAAISTVYLAMAIPFEERGLVQRFGAEYREYQRRVRWRLIPGVY